MLQEMIQLSGRSYRKPIQHSVEIARISIRQLSLHLVLKTIFDLYCFGH